MGYEYRRVWPAGDLHPVALPHRLELLRRNYEKGIESALWEAIRYCHESQYPPPDWVMERLDAEAAVALGHEDREKRQGCKASSPKRAQDIRERELTKAALVATKQAKLRGDKRLKIASELLKKLGIYRSPETLRSPKGLAEVDFNTSQYEFFRRELGLSFDQHGFLVLDDDDK